MLANGLGEGKWLVEQGKLPGSGSFQEIDGSSQEIDASRLVQVMLEGLYLC